MAGSKFGQATVAAVQTDCGARTIHADYSLNFTVYDQPLYISNFMAVARGGICITDDPTMVEFNRRGWAFTYTFTFNDGMAIEQKLIC